MELKTYLPKPELLNQSNPDQPDQPNQPMPTSAPAPMPTPTNNQRIIAWSVDSKTFYKLNEDGILELDLLKIFDKRIEDMSDDELTERILVLQEVRRVKPKKKRDDLLNEVLKRLTFEKAAEIVQMVEAKKNREQQATSKKEIKL